MPGDSKNVRSRRILLVLCLTLALGSFLTSPTVIRGAGLVPRGEADESFHAALTALAAKCDELGLKEQAEVSRDWFVPRDPRRYYLFLPPGVDATKPPDTAPRLVRFWHDKFMELRKGQAETLFGLARQQVQTGDEAVGYRLLYEVLHEDPDHAQARWALGYARGDRGWRRAVRRPTRRRNQGPHPQFGWPRNRYWQVDSEHFELTTNSSAREGRQVASYLERVYAVWQQLFYPYWSIPGRLAARLENQDRSLAPDRVFAVVLFNDRDEYVRQLSPSVPQVEMSIGYYAQDRKSAFFYAGDDEARPNWVHESTHQFFQETGTVAPLVGEQGNFWVLEGVALYMESLIDQGPFATTGGVDAERLQFARFRKRSEGYYVPLDQLVRYGRQQLQQDRDIRKLYSQSAGMTHFLLHSAEGRNLRPFVDYLKAVYRGVGQRQTLEVAVGQRYAQLDQSYSEFLNVTDTDMTFVNSRVRSLCLTRTDVTDAGLARVHECDRLRWLDLSFTAASDAGVAHFAQAHDLDQLNLEKTRITDRTLDMCARFRKLEELDLSQTAITDEGLKKLQKLSQLKVLWLTGTQVTDTGLSALEPLRNLEQLDVQSTRVTPAALDDLRKHLPKLK